jgi:hypothetical protein
MSTTILSLFTTYLIYPILGVILLCVAALVAQKNQLLKNKRLIVYTLVSVVVLPAPALFGFLDYHFMPYMWLALAGLYIVVGAYNDRMMSWVFDNPDVKYHAKIIFTLFQLSVAMMLFVLVFNLCNDLQYGIWAATCMVSYLLPSLLMRSYDIFIHIPSSIYKVWIYESAHDLSASETIDHTKLKVVSVELFKSEQDTQPTRINVKVPEELLFGEWIKLLFDDYNKRSANSPIDVRGVEDSGWIFYVKSWALSPRRYLDHEITVKDNRIREKDLIVAKRVKNIKE